MLQSSADAAVFSCCIWVATHSAAVVSAVSVAAVVSAAAALAAAVQEGAFNVNLFNLCDIKPPKGKILLGGFLTPITKRTKKLKSIGVYGIIN